MLNEQTRHKLHQLKLQGMLDMLTQLQDKPSSHPLSFAEGVALLVDNEHAYKTNQRVKRLLKLAKLRYPSASVSDINYEHKRNVAPDTWQYLTNGQWLNDKRDLLLCGPTGIGKTYLACAFASLACQSGLLTRYYRLAQLLEILRIAHADGSYLAFINQLTKVKCLIIDDWGIEHISEHRRADLLTIFDHQQEYRSLIIGAQLPIAHWHDYIGGHTIADAMLDRFIHSAYVLNFKGDSMRKNIAAS